MAETSRGWSLPEQTTSPPDVVAWLSTLGNDASDDVDTLILYGTAANVPTTLLPGQLYCGW